MFDTIFNNPFRVLGLPSSASDIEIFIRYNDLRVSIENGEPLIFPIDDFFDSIIIDGKSYPEGDIDRYYIINDKNFIAIRTLETIEKALKQLRDPNSRKYYSLFAFDNIDDIRWDDPFSLAIYWESALSLEEKKTNKFSQSYETDFLRFFSPPKNDNYEIEKSYKKIIVKSLINTWAFPEIKSYNDIVKASIKLEFDCQWIEGIDNNLFGISWGEIYENEKSSYYTFGISANGYIYLSNVVNGKLIKDDPDFFEWRKIYCINRNQKNHLEVRYINGSFEFYVNDLMVHKTKNHNNLYYTNISIRVVGKQTVVFSNFKISSYNIDLDYASFLDIHKSNFSHAKNLALYFYIKSIINRGLSSSDIINESLNLNKGEYCPTIMQYYFDKSIALLSRIFQKSSLIKAGIVEDSHNNEILSIFDHLIDDLLSVYKKPLENVSSFIDIPYQHLIFKLKLFDPIFYNRFFDFQKNKLENESSNCIRVKEPDDHLSFPIENYYKDFFECIANNPFRVLGLSPLATNKQISNRVSDLLIYSEMDKAPRYDTDLFFGKIDRSVINIQDSSTKLEKPNSWAYYSLLWFNRVNQLDNDFLESLRIIEKNEEDDIIKEAFLENFGFYLREGMNYSDAFNNIKTDMLNNVLDLASYINIDKTSEATIHCIYKNVLSKLPVSPNVIRSESNIILNSISKLGFWLLKEIYFDKSTDFTISIDCQVLESMRLDQPFGIVFGKGSNTYYKYGITPDGSVFFDHFIGDKPQNIFKFSNKEKIELSSVNTLKISYSKERNIFLLVINEKHIHSYVSEFGSIIIDAPVPAFLGDYIGVFVAPNQKVSFSNFVINYLNEKSREASNYYIDSQNFSSTINFTIWNILNINQFNVWDKLPPSIALMGKLINSEFIPQRVKQVFGKNTIIDTLAIEKQFIDDILKYSKPYLSSNKNDTSLKNFIDAFYSFSNNAQEYIVHKLLGNSISIIEESITKITTKVNLSPLEGNTLGQNLTELTNEYLIEIQEILSYTNLQYRLLANKVSDALLNCAIANFNAISDNRTARYDEVNSSLGLILIANKIVVDGKSRVRVDENLEFFQNWIINHKPNPITPKNQTIKSESDFDILTNLIKDFNENKPLTTLLCKSFVQDSLRLLKKIEIENVLKVEAFSKLSNDLVASVLTFLIDDAAYRERDILGKPVIKEVEFEIYLEHVDEILKILRLFKTNQITQDRFQRFEQKIKRIVVGFHTPINSSPTSQTQSNQDKTNQPKNEEANNPSKNQKQSTQSNKPTFQSNSVNSKNILKNGLHRFKSLEYDTRFLVIMLLSVLTLLFLIILSRQHIFSSKFDNIKNSDTLVSTATPVLENNPTQVNPTSDAWTGNSLKTGNTPYSDFFGEATFNRNLNSSLEIDNTNSLDVIVCLQNYYSRQYIRHVYIRSGETYTLRNLPNGIFFIKAFYGKDWNPDKIIKDKIQGYFERDISYVIYDDPSELININVDRQQSFISVFKLYSIESHNNDSLSMISSDFFR